MAARRGLVTAGVDDSSFVVIDIRDKRRHLVTSKDGRWICTCIRPAAEPAERCDHVWAVHFTIEARGTPEAVRKPAHRRTYSQPNPRAYREGLRGENRWFDQVLLSLLDSIDEPCRPPGRPGRPRTPLREALFITMTKVHECESLDSVHGRLPELAAQGKVSGATNYSLPARLLGREDLTPLLMQLVRDSAKPMIPFEREGTLAIDSSGFTTSVFGAYLTETHEPERRHEFVKAHVAVGTRTHIVTDAVVTDQNHADSPEFAGLLERTVASGFRFAKVVADKGYLSRANYAVGAALGMKVRIDFRSNVGPQPKGVPAWREAWHEKHDRPDTFAREYHPRSNVESMFSSAKRKLREGLFSRRPVARRNELLCKIIVYNLLVVIQQLFEHEIEPAKLFPVVVSVDAEPAIEACPTGWPSTPYESISAAVKESTLPLG